MLAGSTNLSFLAGHSLTIGGLLSGPIAHYISKDVRGGGASVALRGFHDQNGQLPVRTAWAKFIAICTYCTGGSAGRGEYCLNRGEFPVCAADWRTFRADDVLMVAVLPVVAALFRAPLAGAIFAPVFISRP